MLYPLVWVAGVLAWAVLRRAEWPRGTRRLPVIVAATGWALFVLGPGMTSFPLMLVACLVLVLGHGLVAGIVYACVLVVTGVVVPLLLLGPQRLGAIVADGAFIAVMLAFGVVLAELVRRTDDARRATEELAGALRRSVAGERELAATQERARAARDLHDGLGHTLTLAGMSLDFATRTRHRDPERAWAEVDVAREHARVALEQMRALVRAQHPAGADPQVSRSPGEVSRAGAEDPVVGGVAGTEGVTGAGGVTGVVDVVDVVDVVEAVAAGFRGAGVDVRLDVGPDAERLDAETVRYVRHFVQEGLTNAVRHGGATRVDIGVRRAGDVVDLRLRDHGCGAARLEEGFGLRSLRERAGQLDGSFEACAVATPDAARRPGRDAPHEHGVELRSRVRA